MLNRIKQALTVAGSDSGGGAGIQADLKTFQMREVYGMSVICAVTAQNTHGVSAIHSVPIDIILAQLQAINEDFNPSACKVGMLGTQSVIEAVAEKLCTCRFGPIVVDPVMVAKGGSRLLDKSAVSALSALMVPLSDVITPNLPEAYALTGIEVVDKLSATKAALILQSMGAKTVVIKGGHSQESKSKKCCDWVFTDTGDFELEAPRVLTRHTHGTGCTFSACIAAELAKGVAQEEAIRTAKAFITAAISHPLNIGHGHGPTNHWAYVERKRR
ncbi:bifunctional hydroxymethylpyrimidine kinase/phosphomethylpyrimidine kinase [Pasteurellaceae bacterium HPA106]|uniref:bifunctional hydroxymethylpyrimidine kinase/phosphomethylpyrimidine kinase n=1 Tax=Spirabiliibacterium pneumoniae TaxID=221400 RepID=UPI001AADFE21|nr:bifunctional hydroxymethylpyrimidine kinase/phosphomethylpyrimidine kinase [Spirabiliibacterium pneumoniae]MBE2896405.1 bifunctional hydroxymethylpyrimidine kinase/phosphomethylpyrimidine kinase [Spirabiliibacterium pneumoniae]